MNYAPLIESAQPRQKFQIGKFTAVLLGDIQAAGPVEYLYLLMVFDGEDQPPCLIVSSEVNQLAKQLGGGSHYIGVFGGTGHLNCGSSDDWADEAKFTREALRIIDDWIGNGSGQKDDGKPGEENSFRLIEPISEAELERLNNKFKRYEALGPKWEEFLQLMRDGDTLWRVWDPVSEITAIAIVRSGVRVAQFFALSNL